MVTSILKILAAIFAWLTSSRRLAKKDAEEKTQRLERAADEVRSRDVDAVNARLTKYLVVLILPFVVGCAARPKVVYIPAEDKVLPMEHQGRAGWWVPEAVFIRMVQKLEAKEGTR